MNNKFQHITIDSILSRVYRTFGGTEVNEADIIEYIGEALGLLEAPEIQEEAVVFLKVKNYHADIPEYFKAVLQIAKYSDTIENTRKRCGDKNVSNIPTTPKEKEPYKCGEDGLMDCVMCNLHDGYIPYFDMQWQYIPWTASRYYSTYFSPVRLANHTLFNSIVCREREDLYSNAKDEYTIVGTTNRRLRFSFREGQVAMSYLRNPVDPKTGYPTIPDSAEHLSAIVYYIRWKVAETLSWLGRAGFDSQVSYNRKLWEDYKKTAIAVAKLPTTIDELQNHLEQTHNLIVNRNRYYGYFGNLARYNNINYPYRDTV